MKKSFLVALMLVMCAAPVMAGVSGGRLLLDKRDVQFWITAGYVSGLEGDVKETTRTYYDVAGRSEDQEDRESYSFDDFGLDGGYPAIGLVYENAGKYFTFHFGAMYFQPDVSSIAIRNYYIGVDSVRFEGEEYEYMHIPEGQAFTVDMSTVILEIRGMFTPLTLSAGDSFHFTPYLVFGIFGLASEYDIDAGPAEGIKEYLDPPEDFVINGQAEGSLIGGMPEFGLGAEVRFGSDKGNSLVLRAEYAGFQYEGDTGTFTTQDHREKDLDLDHANIKLSCQFEMPFESGKCFTIGVEYVDIETEASITSQEATDEEVLERHERFDKDVDFAVQLVTGHIGWTF